MRTLMMIVMVVGLALGCGGNKGTDAKAATPTESLYKRFGGKEGITKVVDDFVAIVVADERINAFFKNADAANLKKQLVDQICDAASGGTECKYTGKDMKTAHLGMKVKEADFNALVEDLVKALDANHVGEKEKQELLGVLGPMKGDIVSE
jgi:hemoglobin